MFNALECELQKELLDFVTKEESNNEPKPLKITLVAELLRQITKGEREIVGIATNSETGDVFVRFSFTKINT